MKRQHRQSAQEGDKGSRPPVNPSHRTPRKRGSADQGENSLRKMMSERLQTER
jgi:hypothetical protein